MVSSTPRLLLFVCEHDWTFESSIKNYTTFLGVSTNVFRWTLAVYKPKEYRWNLHQKPYGNYALADSTNNCQQQLSADRKTFGVFSSSASQLQQNHFSRFGSANKRGETDLYLSRGYKQFLNLTWCTSDEVTSLHR